MIHDPSIPEVQPSDYLFFMEYLLTQLQEEILSKTNLYNKLCAIHEKSKDVVEL